MVRIGLQLGKRRVCSPHPRGDGPNELTSIVTRSVFSPPAWGWSREGIRPGAHDRVLPTRVGMVRRRFAGRGGRVRSPHPRGDGPALRRRLPKPSAFSPPAWGWSASRHLCAHRNWVLPTRVGMVPAPASSARFVRCSPHPRGDGPERC